MTKMISVAMANREKRDGSLFFSSRKRECGGIVGSGRKKEAMARELGITISKFFKIIVCKLYILSHNYFK